MDSAEDMQRPSIFYGIDPDLHVPALACIERPAHVGGARLVWAGIAHRTPDDFRGAMALEDAACAGADVRGATGRAKPTSLAVVACEMPKKYPGSKVRPQDLIHLAASAGIWAGYVAQQSSAKVIAVEFPYAQDWKGSVPKYAHQARICKRMGWDYSLAGTLRSGRYCVPSISSLPDAAAAVKAADWKHVLDALGLALWAYDRTWASRPRVQSTSETPSAWPSGPSTGREGVK